MFIISIKKSIVHLLIIILSPVLCDNERMEDGVFRASFTVVNKGRMLYPTVLMYVEDVDIGECGNTCGMHLSCATFNYNWDTRECELVGQDFDDIEADVDAPGWYHYGTPPKIDGGFTHWFSTAPCSTSCGDGFETLYRTCTLPEPKYGGRPCTGEDVRTARCNLKPCPIDGGFSDWLNDGGCSTRCGGGQLKQTRSCTRPTPRYNGADCVGDKTQTVSCNNHACPPVDGGFSDWVNDGSCSLTCGGGQMEQTRSCTRPAPQHGGADCVGDKTRTVSCNNDACPPACTRTVAKTCCVFPFEYNGKSYNTCIKWGKIYVCKDKTHLRKCA